MSFSSKAEILRSIPKVDELLEDPFLQKASRSLLLRAIRKSLESFRQEVLSDSLSLSLQEVPDFLKKKILKSLEEIKKPYLRRAINGTGVILHTGLGRAPLPVEIGESLAQNSGYVMLEIEQNTGKRGKREASISALLRELTGAEEATVVNNNAAATLISLATLATGKEVVVSRGQLVEIGGSFRIPEVMAQGGAILKEVGCTNKTHREDYLQAICEKTALLLEVHPSNYRIQGFVEAVSTEELVELGKEQNIPVMYDMGSGNLVDLQPYGIGDEPTVQEKIKSGVDLLTFSGDKLLGGPQAGIIVGKKKYVDAIRRHPLFRAIRPGKLELAALERVLHIYLWDNPMEKIPGLKMLSIPLEELKKRGQRILSKLQNFLFSSPLEYEIQEDFSQIGSGALPIFPLPSVALAIRCKEKSAEDLSRELRVSEPPVFSHIQDGWVLLNLRTIFPEEEDTLVEILKDIS